MGLRKCVTACPTLVKSDADHPVDVHLVGRTPAPVHARSAFSMLFLLHSIRDHVQAVIFHDLAERSIMDIPCLDQCQGELSSQFDLARLLELLLLADPRRSCPGYP